MSEMRLLSIVTVKMCRPPVSYSEGLGFKPPSRLHILCSLHDYAQSLHPNVNLGHNTSFHILSNPLFTNCPIIRYYLSEMCASFITNKINNVLTYIANTRAPYILRIQAPVLTSTSAANGNKGQSGV